MRNFDKLESIRRKKCDYHLCISCGNLLRITRKVKKDGNRRIVGYRYVAQCVHARYPRNPWVGNKCPHWVQMPGQKELIDFLKVEHGEDEEED